MKIEVGKKYRITYGENNHNNRLMHIVGIVEGQYVYRVWSRKWQWWVWLVEAEYYFKLNEDITTCAGNITPVREQPDKV